MVSAVAAAHGDRHQQTSGGADRDDAREQERRRQAAKHIRSFHDFNPPQLGFVLF